MTSLPGSAFLSECLYAFADRGRNAHQRINEVLLDLQKTLVFGKIPSPVRLIQYTPLLAWQVDRVLQALKHDVAALGTITVPPQGSERQCVRRVVREVESTLEAERGIPGIL
jgi:hypothetical protein